MTVSHYSYTYRDGESLVAGLGFLFFTEFFTYLYDTHRDCDRTASDVRKALFILRQRSCDNAVQFDHGIGRALIQ